MSSGDTIAAIATAPGQAGIGIVRLSGPDALACARAVFFRERNGQRTPLDTELRPRQVVYGGVAEGMAGSRLDSCLLTYFQAPRSYTGEDVVELACHGSTVVLSLLLQALLGTGARLAEPGEFTRRAFLNGRLDLTEAESVMDLIAARTAAAARVAAGQQGGRLAREIEALRMLLLDLLAEIEASIDFPDDVDPLPDCELAARAEEVRARCSRLLATSGAGRLYREGARLVIVGRPNVGKSSLLNALLGENRAIVTEVAGTTRDVVEEDVNLGGIPVRAADTAGLRETEDRIEALGVERTRERLASADLVVWVLDAAVGLTEADRALGSELAGRRVVLVGNKQDLGNRLQGPDWETWVESVGPVAAPAPVSCRTEAGIVGLRATLAQALLGGSVAPESILVSNVRHEARLRSAEAALDRAITAAREGFDQAAISLDLRLAVQALGEITGTAVTEETIHRIFARFCIGK